MVSTWVGGTEGKHLSVLHYKLLSDRAIVEKKLKTDFPPCNQKPADGKSFLSVRVRWRVALISNPQGAKTNWAKVDRTNNPPLSASLTTFPQEPEVSLSPSASPNALSQHRHHLPGRAGIRWKLYTRKLSLFRNQAGAVQDDGKTAHTIVRLARHTHNNLIKM